MIHICGVALDKKWWTIFILECWEKKLLKNEFTLDLKTCPLGNLVWVITSISQELSPSVLSSLSWVPVLVINPIYLVT